MASIAWVAGLYSDLVSPPAPSQRIAPPAVPESEDRTALLPPLPATAANLYADLQAYRLCYQPAVQQFLLEDDTRSTALLRAPSAFDDGDWSRCFAGAPPRQDEESWQTLFTIPLRPWDETADAQRWRGIWHAPPSEDEQPQRLPFVPPPIPNLGWDDFDWNHDFSAAARWLSGGGEDARDILPTVPFPTEEGDASAHFWGAQGLLAIVTVDELVGVPSGGGFGAASRGRSARLGLSFPAFR